MRTVPQASGGGGSTDVGSCRCAAGAERPESALSPHCTTGSIAVCRFLLGSLAFNYLVLFVRFFAFVFARDGLRRLHGRWFRLPDATFDAIHYGGVAVYTIGILLFNLAPLVALCLMRGGS